MDRIAATTRADLIGGRALVALLGVLFLTFLDTTVVSVTLGDLENDLKAGVLPLQWVLNAYSLTFAALLLAAGALADRWGRRRLMLVGLACFALGSVLAATAGTIGAVIAGRAVMGVGAAAAEPGTLSILRQLYPHEQARARALGWWSAVSGLALAAGPVLGGALVGVAGWRAVFWFNLVAAAVLAAAVRGWVPERTAPAPRSGRPDLAGFVLGALGIGALTGAMIAGESAGFTDRAIVGGFVLGLVALAVFVAVEARHPSPMLDLRLLRAPGVPVALAAAFAVYFGVFAIFFFTALYLVIAVTWSGWALAGLFAPMAVAIVAGGLRAGAWVGRHGARPVLALGCLVAAAGTAGARFALDRPHPAPVQLAVFLAVAGAGFGVTVVPLTSTVLGAVPERSAGMAAAATVTARQLGSVAGVAVLGAIVNGRLVDAVSAQFTGPLAGSRDAIRHVLESGGAGIGNLGAVPAPYLSAFRSGLDISLSVAAALLAVTALLAWRTPARDGRPVSAPTPPA